MGDESTVLSDAVSYSPLAFVELAKVSGPGDVPLSLLINALSEALGYFMTMTSVSWRSAL